MESPLTPLPSVRYFLQKKEEENFLLPFSETSDVAIQLIVLWSRDRNQCSRCEGTKSKQARGFLLWASEELLTRKEAKLSLQ